MFFAKLCFLVPCLAIAMAATQGPNPASKPTVTIFYENLCPDSVKFMADNFYKLYVSAKLNESMIVKLNSYGNTNSTALHNGTHAFTCEHGATECYRNELHACVINKEADREAVLKFVNCSLFEGYYNSSKNTIDDCATNAGINVTAMYECANSSVGNGIYFNQGEEFHKMGIESVPSVVFNNTFNKTVSAAAVENFSDAFCNFVKANNLSNEYCKSKENSASIPSVSFLTFVIASILLVKMYQ